MRPLGRLYAKTALESSKVRLKLLKGASSAKLAASRDPFIKLAVALRPTQKEMEERSEAADGAEALLKPTYLAALREISEGPARPRCQQHAPRQLRDRSRLSAERQRRRLYAFHHPLRGHPKGPRSAAF